MNSPVPVIMYHSIGIPNKKWRFNYLTCPYNIFEDQLKWLKNRGFNTISLMELYNYMSKGIKLPKNPVILTFDDGYLDNWVFVYPLLKKYDFKGTIYVNPEFVDKRKIVRANLEDSWNKKVNIKNLETLGYLSWEEMKIMEEEHVMDIQSHTMTHTWYPKGDKIIDFRHPKDPYLWMTWNNNPHKKPFLQIDNEELISFGQPIYENDRALGIRRYFPDETLEQFLIDYVNEKDNNDFYKLKDWKNELYNLSNEYKMKNHSSGRFESDKEYKNRINYELGESKRIIENELKKEVKFLCWPGGALTAEVLETASELGYLSSTVGKDLKNQRKTLNNIFGEDPSRINRIGTTSYRNGLEGPKSKIVYKNGFFLLLSLYMFQKRKIISNMAYLTLGAVQYYYKFKYSI